MSSKKLISPKFKITVGNYILTEGISVECFSSRESHADWCTVELNSRLNEGLSFKDMDVATVLLGYEDDYDILISGYVRITKDDYWKKITIKDELLKLERTRLKNTFIDCTPQDILKYILESAGIKSYMLSDLRYPSKAVFATDLKTCIDIITAVNSYWGLNNSFFFQDGIFYWGCKKSQETMYMLEESSNILSMKKYNRLWEIETIGIPWIHQSQLISINHSLYSGVAEVCKTIVKSDDQGFVRMYLYFEGSG